MQPDLFLATPAPRKLARRDNPATSKAAAATVPNFSTMHHAVIVQALKDHGTRGLTVHEIAAFCRLDAHAIGKRVNELEKAKVIECVIVPDGDAPDGYTVLTRPSPSGRQARVWVLVKGRCW